MNKWSGQALGVLTQLHENHQTTIVYYNISFYSVAKAYTLCFASIMALIQIIEACELRFRFSFKFDSSSC